MACLSACAAARTTTRATPAATPPTTATPAIITTAPTRRPASVTGTWSPYPVVVIVVSAHHRPSPHEPQVCPGTFRSSSQTADPPSSTTPADTPETTMTVRTAVARATEPLVVVTKSSPLGGDELQPPTSPFPTPVEHVEHRSPKAPAVAQQQSSQKRRGQRVVQSLDVKRRGASGRAWRTRS